MPKYQVLTAHCTLGAQGATVELDDDSGVNVRALERSGHIRVKPLTKKQAATAEDGD